MSDKDLQEQTGLRWANAGSFLFVLLQSACTAVMAISGFRLLIGLSALAAASGVYGPARGFHQDAIRIPMMIVALVGALANLYSVWRVRSLRARPASGWRVRPVSSDKLRSERVQIGLAVLTLVLLAGEWVTHAMIHRV
jgi:ABC-type xylose transport system permease subunit